jgi:hypothetical protein
MKQKQFINIKQIKVLKKKVGASKAAIYEKL